jgi:thiamine-phosphate pyrophosphorylase
MTARIVDANFNRLREGVRVIEDVARLGLDDAMLAGRLKQLRHAAAALRLRWPGDPLSARDSAGDVGREKIPEPARRADAAEVLGAAFGRVQEALRVVEEMAKLERPAVAREAKALRYEAYALEREIVPLFDRRARLALMRGLYLVMTEPVSGHEKLAEIAVKEKIGAIQLRDKRRDGGLLLKIARRLRAITRGTRTLFIVNDRADIAALAEADGLHVGQADLSVADARAIVGERMLIGKSTHNTKQLRAALAERPDYVAIGPVFGTTSKSDSDPKLGLRKAKTMLLLSGSVPAVAIGGIDCDRLRSVLEAGFTHYALISEVNGSVRPEATIRRLRRLERS